MSNQIITIACISIGLSSALVAGVFQAFSEFVMKALIQAKPASGVDAMQMINRTVFKTVFLVLLIGLTPVTAAIAIYAYFNIASPATTWIIAGAVIYVIGVFLVTMRGNVPMNERLDKMDNDSAETFIYWTEYGTVWTRWNHVRMLGSLATAICFIIAGVLMS
ncbi:MAG: DUF1772 domain-containing protein [Henriciella sp.]|nr:DUF1772 domain-containing protein [Henriciella sp.]